MVPHAGDVSPAKFSHVWRDWNGSSSGNYLSMADQKVQCQNGSWRGHTFSPQEIQ